MDSRKPPNVSPVGNTPGAGARQNNKEGHPNNDGGNDSDREMKLRVPATNLGRKIFKDSEVSSRYDDGSLEPSGREDGESKDLERQNYENQEHIKAQRLKNIKNGIERERTRQEQAAANDGAAGRGGSRRQQQERRDNINDSYDEEEEQDQR